MASRTKDGEAFEGRPYRGHGDVYRWLREHYDYVEGWIKKKNPPGEEIAARIAREAVVGARGKAPTSRSVRKVWARVCRDVAGEREREAAEQAERDALAERRRNYPSRQLAAQPLGAEATGRALVPVGEAQTAMASGESGEQENTITRAKRRLQCFSGKRPMSDF
jgi:hypothetical protein